MVTQGLRKGLTTQLDRIIESKFVHLHVHILVLVIMKQITNY